MKKPSLFWDQNAGNHMQSAWDRNDWDQNDFYQDIGKNRKSRGFNDLKPINLKNQNRQIVYLVFIMVSLICTWIPLLNTNAEAYNYFSSNLVINNVVFLFILNVLLFLSIKQLQKKRNMMNSSQQINHDDTNQKQYEIPNIQRIKLDLPKFSDINIEVNKKIITIIE
jgi:hypothetical protein